MTEDTHSYGGDVYLATYQDLFPLGISGAREKNVGGAFGNARIAILKVNCQVASFQCTKSNMICDTKVSSILKTQYKP